MEYSLLTGHHQHDYEKNTKTDWPRHRKAFTIKTIHRIECDRRLSQNDHAKLTLQSTTQIEIDF